jgi:hypothetical protein
MRRRAKIDANQPDIVSALRKAGVSVKSLAPMGDGYPDLLVGKYGRNWLFEVKDPAKPKSKRALTTDERAFHAEWLGQIATIETAEEALAMIFKS